MATRGGQKRSVVPRDNVFHLKLVLLGAVAVGKTKLALRFAKGEFTEHYEVTIGAFYTKTVVNLDGMTVKFEIWDTAGQERFRSLAPMYYRGAQAAIVVYDITNADSFVRAQSWVRELQRETGPDIVIALAGNKVDLSRERVVHFEEAQTFADTNGLLFRETSAKTAKNVNDMFMAIAKKVPKRHTSGLQRPTTKTKEPYVSNHDPRHKPAPSGNCCK